MGMMSYGAWDVYIPSDSVEKMCKEQYDRFITALEDKGVSLREYVVDYEDMPESKPIRDAWIELAECFLNKTGYDLGISYSYTEQDDPDIGEIVEDGFFTIQNFSLPEPLNSLGAKIVAWEEFG